MEASFLHVCISIIHKVDRPEITYSIVLEDLQVEIDVKNSHTPCSLRLFVAVQVAPLPCLIPLFTSPESCQS